MKVVDMIKHKTDSLAKHQFELKDLMSPVLREYWADFINRANSQQIFPWLKDHQTPAVNEEVAPTVVPEIEMSPEAEALYLELSEKIDQEIHVGDWLSVDSKTALMPLVKLLKTCNGFILMPIVRQQNRLLKPQLHTAF